jgi:hypothetical protein
MPTPDEWSRQIDEALFGEDAPDTARDAALPGALDLPLTPEVQPRRAVALDEVDTALFGLHPPSSPATPVTLPLMLDEDETPATSEVSVVDIPPSR